jgi:hypothetical protein
MKGFNIDLKGNVIYSTSGHPKPNHQLHHNSHRHRHPLSACKPISFLRFFSFSSISILIFSGSLRLPAAFTGGNNFAISGSAIVSISNTHALGLNFFSGHYLPPLFNILGLIKNLIRSIIIQIDIKKTCTVFSRMIGD